MGILRRLCLLISIPLFITTIVIIVPLFFVMPIYWLITGRSYVIDIIDWINWSVK